MGSRVIDLSNPIVYIEREDLQHSALRLKELVILILMAK